MKYSVLKLNELDHVSLRIDAEYYQSSYLDAERKIKKSSWDFLKNLTNSIKSFGAYSLCNQVSYKESGVPFLRCKDIKDGVIDLAEVLYIDYDANKLLWKSEVKPRTVLFTMSGTVGNSAIASEYMIYPINSNQDIAKIETNEKLNPYFLYVFFRSFYGRNQILRLPVGSVQQHIFLWQIENFIVPIFDVLFQEKIKNIVLYCDKIKSDSLSCIEQAINILLSELGLTNWKPKHQLSFVRNFSEVEEDWRMDAEYYQPKYDELIEIISSSSAYSKTIAEIQTYNARGVQPEYDENGKLDVIASRHILENGLDYDSFERTDSANWNLQKKARVYKGDILTYTTGANIGRTAHYAIDKPALASNHVNILRIKDERPEYVAFVMNSMIGRLQTDRLSAGSAQAELYPKDIENYVIPFIAEQAQQNIISLLEESRILKEQSKHLLDCAKRAVEIAIEQDEQAAIEWLEKETA
jgi:restriction endonuclease S subunit